MATETIGGFSHSRDAFPHECDPAGFRSPEWLLDFSFSPEAAAKPAASQTGYFLEGSRLLKQMGRARDNRQMLFRIDVETIRL